MMVRITVPLSRDVWCQLRRVAEEQKQPTGRASISEVVREMIARALGKEANA